MIDLNKIECKFCGSPCVEFVKKNEMPQNNPAQTSGTRMQPEA
jgi:hypothetical protein